MGQKLNIQIEMDIPNSRESKVLANTMNDIPIYSMLEERGYTVDVKVENNSKVVRFNGKYATKKSSEKIQAWYSLEWSNEEIKRDIAAKLLKWSGLKLKTVLDY